MTKKNLAILLNGDLKNKNRGPYLRLVEYLNSIITNHYDKLSIEILVPSLFTKKDFLLVNNSKINIHYSKITFFDFFKIFSLVFFKKYPLQSSIFYRKSIKSVNYKYDYVHLITSRLFCNIENTNYNKVSIDYIDSLALNNNRYKRVAKFRLLKFFYKIESLRLYNLEKSISSKLKHKIIISNFDRRFLKINANIVQGFSHIPNTLTCKNKINKKFFCFTGNLKYKSNVSAILFFINKIYPYLESDIQESFYIIGKSPNNSLIRFLKKKNINTLYDVKDIYCYIKNSHFTIAPMIDVSGQKNKIIDSLLIGTPAITSIIGSQGIPLYLTKFLNIYNSKSHFIELINKFYFNNKIKLHLKSEIHNKNVKKQMNLFNEERFK